MVNETQVTRQRDYARRKTNHLPRRNDVMVISWIVTASSQWRVRAGPPASEQPMTPGGTSGDKRPKPAEQLRMEINRFISATAERMDSRPQPSAHRKCEQQQFSCHVDLRAEQWVEAFTKRRIRANAPVRRRGAGPRLVNPLRAAVSSATRLRTGWPSPGLCLLVLPQGFCSYSLAPSPLCAPDRRVTCQHRHNTVDCHERKQAMQEARQQIATVVLPTLAVVVLLIVVFVYVATRPGAIE
ncbi:hypothetical protein INR49_010011 [Caranx melampygus]|nr:hypothetical protein INR49_010011 [Caranx melampygus]